MLHSLLRPHVYYLPQVDNESFYKLLGVPKDADESEIKKSFRKLAMKHHPDKGMLGVRCFACLCLRRYV